MKKLIIVLCLIVFISWCNLQKNQETKPIISNPITEEQTIKEIDYYDIYFQKCNESSNKNCCISSVNNAKENDSKVYSWFIDDISCPEWTQPTTNKCMWSYKWCEKISK
jgi:hypothetical protein